MRKRKYLAWLLVFVFVFSLVTGNTTQVMAKGGREADVIKSVSLEIGKKNVTKKTYTMKTGETEKLKVTISPQKGNKTILYATSNKKTAAVSKSGKITAKQAGTARIKVTVKSGGAEKTTWVKVKVKKSSGTDKNTTETGQPAQTPEPTETPDISTRNKNLVVYFSCTDNTKKVAEYVAESADADIYRIEAAQPYTSADLDYTNSDSRTSKENRDAAVRPEIAGELPSLDGYTDVYIGYPIWHGQAPKILYTFVENCNLSGKTVIPFCTSASSGIGTSVANLQAADTSQATWLPGRRFSGSSPKSDVENWILELGLQ